MKARLLCGLVVVALGGVFQAQPVETAASDREKFIGVWRLVSLQSPGADGKVVSVPGLKGTLIYTRDGHVAVQIMYPRISGHALE